MKLAEIDDRVIGFAAGEYRFAHPEPLAAGECVPRSLIDPSTFATLFGEGDDGEMIEDAALLRADGAMIATRDFKALHGFRVHDTDLSLD